MIMASPSIRGIGRSSRLLQRQWAIPVTRISRLPCQSVNARYIAGQWTSRNLCQSRAFHATKIRQDAVNSSSNATGYSAQVEKYNDFFDFPPQSPAEDFQQGNTVTIHGFISKRKDRSKNIASVNLLVDSGPSLQFESSWDEVDTPEHAVHKSLKSAPAWSPVALTGRIERYQESLDVEFGTSFPAGRNAYHLTLLGVHLLNPFPKDLIISDGANFPADRRHLQLRFDRVLQDRLKLRNQLTAKADEFLRKIGFSHIETPVLFKSTPEGAREFLVPTRRPGYAYALPQSPQQYKQMLMASGVRKYFQFARCFRDEDLRADRQPEFTQLDLEMSFATGRDVMALVEGLVQHLYAFIRQNWRTRDMAGQLIPTPASARQDAVVNEDAEHTFAPYPAISPGSEGQTDGHVPFPRITYEEAMSLYGSDKPDLRIPNKIHRIDNILSTPFKSMISSLQDPIVEACVFRFQDPELNTTLVPSEDPEPADPQSTQLFITSLLQGLPRPLAENAHGLPVALVIDPSKPLCGLSSLGHEAATEILASDALVVDAGDVLVLQARPNAPLSGGATALGTLRKHIYDQAVEHRFLPFDKSFQFLWVTSFPLFSPTDPSTKDPGQGGAAGFSATHHPFTAPLTPADFSLLATDPLAAKADHYDLVVNGVELGGGSRRIHVAAVQEHVFRNVLKMSDAGIEHFSHLLEALRAGCPPHAGFAFGWDRVCATLGYTGSVRDVIPFPKSKRGEEVVARAPGRVKSEEWAVYGLRHID